MNYISTDKAPKAIGPYSQAIACGPLLFCSGQIPLDPVSMEVVEGGVEAQTEQVFTNMEAVLAEAGVALKDVIKATVFLADMGDFPKVNAIYEKRFGDHKPARSTVEVARLPKDVAVEIEVICNLAV